jgi:hypothetical protein
MDAGILKPFKKKLYYAGYSNFLYLSSKKPNRSMKKIITVFLGSILAFVHLQAQTDYSWVKTMGGNTTKEYGYGIGADASGNVYATGYYESGTFDNITPTGKGREGNAYFVKYNAAGVVQWVKLLYASEASYAFDMAVDKAGNIYITGIYVGTMKLDNTVMNTKGGFDIFVAKFSSSGSLIWAKTAGGVDYDKATSIAVDPDGNVFIGGFFASTSHFGTDSITSRGGDDAFMAKYDPNGNIQWVKSVGGLANEESWGITADNSGNAYLSGYYGNKAFFGSDSLVSKGGDDAFLIKYDGSGNQVWVKTAGAAKGDDQALSVATDLSGNVYLAGGCQDSADFSGTIARTKGGQDIFLACYSPAGQLSWLHTDGGIGDDYVNDICVDQWGNSWITGVFYNSATIGSTALTGVGGSYFTASYSNTGSGKWGVCNKNPGGSSNGNCIAMAGGYLYTSGEFSGKQTFNNIPQVQGGAVSDVFITKMFLPSSAIQPEEQKGLAFSIYPNPATGSVYIHTPDAGNYSFTVSDLSGRQVLSGRYTDAGTHEMGLAALKPGIYIVKLQTADAEGISRLLVY